MFRYTGAGILVYLLIFIAPVLGWLLGWPDDPVTLLIELGVLYLLTGGIVTGLGSWLNLTREPGGARVWTDAHTLDGEPMQRPAAIFAVSLALLAFVGAAGTATGSAAVVLLTAAGILAVTIGVPALRRLRRQSRTAGRRRVVGGPQRRVWDVDPDLPKRWTIMRRWMYGPAARRSMTASPYIGPAYGVVGFRAGTVDVTVFDAVRLGPSRLTQHVSTTWLIHFPVVLPTVEVTAGDAGGPVRIQADNARFARDLVTPQVVDTLRTLGFRQWRVECWDLVCTRVATTSNEELLAVADALASLAARLPAGLLTEHGRATLPGVSTQNHLTLDTTGVLPRIPRRPQ